ncbi:MAG: DUF559 domain-containing protein [Chloroflexi bacterium]|nr:DUF559 domain-containing protein [Chloroflexota bacterium]
MRYTSTTHHTRARKLRKNPTDAERVLWTHLRKRRIQGYRFRRQHPVPPFITDFACPQLRLVIELDGSQHDENREADESRSLKLAEAGYRVIRFWNTDIHQDIDTVLDAISNAVKTCEKRWQ